VDAHVARRNATAYQEAVDLLIDLREVAPDFAARLQMLRRRHSAKTTFIARLNAAGLA
jgi:hypothetical protein